MGEGVKNPQNLVNVAYECPLDVNWSVTLSTMGLIGFLQTLIIVLILDSTCFGEYGIDRVFLVLTGIFSFIGQIFFTLGTIHKLRCRDFENFVPL